MISGRELRCVFGKAWRNSRVRDCRHREEVRPNIRIQLPVSLHPLPKEVWTNRVPSQRQCPKTHNVIPRGCEEYLRLHSTLLVLVLETGCANKMVVKTK